MVCFLLSSEFLEDVMIRLISDKKLTAFLSAFLVLEAIAKLVMIIYGTITFGSTPPSTAQTWRILNSN